MRVDKIIEIMEPTLLLDIVSISKLGGGAVVPYKLQPGNRVLAPYKAPNWVNYGSKTTSIWLLGFNAIKSFNQGDPKTFQCMIHSK